MPIRRTSNRSSYDSGFYNPEVYSDVGSRRIFEFDSNALTYINAVEAADGQALEFNVKVAYNNFVLGCKSDGIWSAIKASCIMAGARTLSGALIPLVGVAPSGFNLASGTYSRVNGLKGDGVAMYLDSNRRNDSDPQNNAHCAVYVTTASSSIPAGQIRAPISAADLVSTNFSYRSIYKLYLTSPLLSGVGFYNRTSDFIGPSGITQVGFMGATRSSSSSFTYRIVGADTSVISSSFAPGSTTLGIFAERFNGALAGSFFPDTLSFYSIGESLDLALLDARVSGLMVAISGAIA